MKLESDLTVVSLMFNVTNGPNSDEIQLCTTFELYSNMAVKMGH